MKEYKQPETRIKRVKDWAGERFYAQHKQVILPWVLWEWQNTRASLLDDLHAPTLEEAKLRIDKFLEKSKKSYEHFCRMTSRPKVKKEVEYIKYP